MNCLFRNNINLTECNEFHDRSEEVYMTCQISLQLSLSTFDFSFCIREIVSG